MDSLLFAARRAALLSSVEQAVVIVPAARLSLRNGDTTHAFRQNSDFYYLTGVAEEDCVLLLSNCHAEHRSVLFVPPRDAKRERWDGPMLGVESAAQLPAIDAAFPLDKWDEELPKYLRGAERVYGPFSGDRAWLQALWPAWSKVQGEARRGVQAPHALLDFASTLHELRLHKSPAELVTMQRAADITAEAHAAAMHAARPGVYEYQVEAEMLRVFRRHDARPAYESIVASGSNATVLHYRQNQRRMQTGELLLIDAGGEFDCYAADVTRTMPVGGRFSAEQRTVYDLVLQAQELAIAAVQPAATLEDVHQAALRCLVEGLLELGLLAGSLDEVIEKKLYEPFFMHRTSHWLGMDVHDAGAYYLQGKPRPLQEGFVLTVEPGLYIRDDAEVEARWRGIGVRIEDDIAVTAEGCKVLTAAIPKQPGDLEAALRA